MKRNERLQRLHVPGVERRVPSPGGHTASPGVPTTTPLQLPHGSEQ
jgi:hypothetical protein